MAIVKEMSEVVVIDSKGQKREREYEDDEEDTARKKIDAVSDFNFAFPFKFIPSFLYFFMLPSFFSFSVTE